MVQQRIPIATDAPVGKTLSIIPSGPDAANSGAFEMVNGKAYMIAGLDQANTETDRVIAFDTGTNEWKTGYTTVPIDGGLYDMGSAVLNGKIHTFGGRSGGSYYVDHYEYNPAEDVWFQRADLPNPLQLPGAAALGGSIYVAGGYDGTNYYSDLRRYDPDTDSFTQLTDMPVKLGGPGLASNPDDNLLYAFGGLNDTGTATDDLFIYDVDADSWNTNAGILDSTHSAPDGFYENNVIYTFHSNVQPINATLFTSNTRDAIPGDTLQTAVEDGVAVINATISGESSEVYSFAFN